MQIQGILSYPKPELSREIMSSHNQGSRIVKSPREPAVWKSPLGQGDHGPTGGTVRLQNDERSLGSPCSLLKRLQELCSAFSPVGRGGGGVGGRGE